MLQNNEINLLPTEVSEKIAAGEVVNRPLSIAKELVENSIDAGADSIVLEIKSGGKTYIRVTDNGMGIPPNEVGKAFQRHATSKIQRAEDLDTIGTLGFRGEALTSIAAVSKVEIITKTGTEKIGTRMVIEGGHILDSDPVGCPNGTTIIVTDLFYNTPARLKFMKTDGAEGSLIIDFFSKMALAYPHIRFRMINNGAVLFATRGNGSIYNNILTIYSKQIGNKLIEIDETEGEYRVQAFISPPDISRPNRRGQVYFVNGRSVSNKVLEIAVSTAYRERIADGRNPLVYLFLQVPANRVDVNIHPNKREVRFDNNNEVSEFIVSALRKGLQSKSGLSVLKMRDPFKRHDPGVGRIDVGDKILGTGLDDGVSRTETGIIPDKGTVVRETTDKRITTEATADQGKIAGATAEKGIKEDMQVDIKSILSTLRNGENNAERNDGGKSEKKRGKEEHVNGDGWQQSDLIVGDVSEDASDYPTYPTKSKAFHLEELRPLGSIFATYILAVDEEHFYLIDQHAAHERVFYEMLLKQFEQEEKSTQLLLSPVILETSPAIANSAELWIGRLYEMGFEIEPFGVKAFIVKGIPSFMELEQSKNFLEGFIGEIEITGSVIDTDKLSKIIMRACKSAVKANDALGMDEIRHLLKELSQTENPLSCPHGRPTLLMLSIQDIERLFKRA